MAYSTIYPLYNSINTNNRVRSAMAATYACYSNVNIFKILSDTIDFPGDLGGSGLWEFFAKEFPSTANPDDKRPQAALNGMDAVMSIISPTMITVPGYMVNSTSYNPGSLLYTDRIDDANALLTFLGMSFVGSMENRFGLPTSNYHKSVALPWADATLTKGDGCAFAAALLHISDGISYISDSAPANVSESYSTIKEFLIPSMNTGCAAGCLLCGISCSACPISLRDRTSCTGEVTDINSCAAAGIIAFVNSSWQGPP